MLQENNSKINNLPYPSPKIKLLSYILFALAIILIIIGSLISYKVYDKETKDFGIISFYKIKDMQLVIDSTFSGTIKKGDKLYSTYDRSQPAGRRACPT